MAVEYRYFARVTQTSPSADDPSIVCRQWTDADGRTHEEQFTTDLRWRESRTSYYVASGKLDGTMVPITEEAARRFEEETQPARVRSYEPADGQYSYSVVVSSVFPIWRPRALLRTWRSPQGYSMEQAWTHTAGWLQSDYLYLIRTDRLDADQVAIAEEDVARFKGIAEMMYLEGGGMIEFRYFAIVAEGHTVDEPLMLLRQWEYGGAVREEVFTEDLAWEPADLVRQYGEQAVPVDKSTAWRLENAQAERYRERHGSERG